MSFIFPNLAVSHFFIRWKSQKISTYRNMILPYRNIIFHGNQISILSSIKNLVNKFCPKWYQIESNWKENFLIIFLNANFCNLFQLWFWNIKQICTNQETGYKTQINKLQQLIFVIQIAKLVSTKVHHMISNVDNWFYKLTNIKKTAIAHEIEA